MNEAATMKMVRTRSLSLNKAPVGRVNNGLVKRSSTMSHQPKQPQFPTSPELILGEELTHFGHPQHVVTKVDLPDLYTCSGCKEGGAGKRFVCKQCDFHLHEFCAVVPQVLESHPFHCHHQLWFYSKPVKGGMAKTKCDICSKPTKGYSFRCGACSFQMHPCCAMLSAEINLPSFHPHPLRLLPASSSYTTNGYETNGFTCGECQRKRAGRMYRCTACEYHLHAVCAKDMINGLKANGFNKGHEKPKYFGTAARFASQVVVDLIGGLMEGIGEGVGEAIVQGVAPRGSTTGVIPRARIP